MLMVIPIENTLQANGAGAVSTTVATSGDAAVQPMTQA
jgi:hypothetical protein